VHVSWYGFTWFLPFSLCFVVDYDA
jgi:hypothetical protein